MVLELGWCVWRKCYYTKYQKISMFDIKIITWEIFHVYLQELPVYIVRVLTLTCWKWKMLT